MGTAEFFQYIQRPLTVLRLQHRITFGMKQVGHAFPDIRIVIDHKYHSFIDWFGVHYFVPQGD
jgi:hypothetical protein